ncbi:MAG: Bax inhibitor-1/YccA family protein [Actinomycetota bacterium]|nr:Bax inhibitor-1/YccA family protein [Actinomycetota bacterium]
MAFKSNNPVFSRVAGFNGKNPQGNVTYPGNGQGYAGYGSPSTWSTGSATTTARGGSGQAYDLPPTHAGEQGRMTIDTTVQKTGITLGVLVLAAAATWVLTGNPVSDRTALNNLYVLSLVGALGGFALAMVNSFKKVVSPPLVIGYAVLEGVFIGAMSKVFENIFGGGIVAGAVVGTIAAFAGTLAAYKFFDIKVGNKFRKWVTAAMFGFVGLVMLDFVLSFFKADIGINGFGPLGLIMSVIGLGLGVLMLILDFDFVERGVEAGLPEQESWRAAFGLTVTIVWIYIELLRILAILRGN